MTQNIQINLFIIKQNRNQERIQTVQILQFRILY